MGKINGILKEMIEENPSVMKDDQRLKSLLRAWYAGDKLSANVLFTVYDSGIVDNAKLIGRVSEDYLRGYVNDIENDYGIKPEVAKNYIIIWLEALGVEYKDYVITTDSKSETATGTANNEEQEKQAVRKALSTLSHSEAEAVSAIMNEFDGMECKMVASKIADRFGITRSVIVNTLKKLEAAGLLQSKSMGAKGTYIKIINKYLPEIVNSNCESSATWKYRMRM